MSDTPHDRLDALRAKAQSAFSDLRHDANMRAEREAFYSPMGDYMTDEQYNIRALMEYLNAVDEALAAYRREKGLEE